MLKIMPLFDRMCNLSKLDRVVEVLYQLDVNMRKSKAQKH